MHGFRPAHGGQLVLWHGEAGTGKTFALRALAWEWRDWCSSTTSSTRTRSSAQHADYLMGVLLQPGWEGMARSGPRAWADRRHGAGASEAMFVEDGTTRSSRSKGWRLLVLEDTGELLTAGREEPSSARGSRASSTSSTA